ncbi:MAG: uridine kinase [Oscillospiraceae bacterium]|nr:uridine kinase [Oscillospiraceae bacterium]
MNTPVVIGIAGGSGSGKTTFAERVVKHFEGPISVLCHDYYYKPFAEMDLEERKRQNYDHPSSFDTDLMVEDLRRLKERKVIYRPVYSYEEFTRLKETIPVEPTDVIVVDGILIFENKELRDLMDIKIFVDTDDDIRFIRRLLRDVVSRGRTVDSVVNQYLRTVKPMHDTFVSPSKKYADIIIPQGGQNQVALDMVISRIDKIMAEKNL